MIQFATPFICDHDLLPAARGFTWRLIPASFEGVGGPSEHLEGRVEWIECGGYTRKLPLAAYAQARAGAFARIDIAGIIGGELLRRYLVPLDCPHGRLFLAARPSVRRPLQLRRERLDREERWPALPRSGCDPRR